MSAVSNATLRDNKVITDRGPSPDAITRQLYIHEPKPKLFWFYAAL